MNNRTFKLYVGVDCGVTTGLALWVKERKAFHFVKSTTILQAIEEVKQLHRSLPGCVLVRIEDARLRKWIPTQKNEKAERGRAKGAGSVMRDAQIWEEFLTTEGIPHELVAPKNNKTKVTADYFRQMTGWFTPTNNHGRDAAMLVLGY